MTILKKWCANVWANEVYTARVVVKELPESWSLVDGSARNTAKARGFATNFTRNPPQLFGSERDALQALCERCDAYYVSIEQLYSSRKMDIVAALKALEELK